jgi:hypothetical protein
LRPTIPNVVLMKTAITPSVAVSQSREKNYFTRLV